MVSIMSIRIVLYIGISLVYGDNCCSRVEDATANIRKAIEILQNPKTSLENGKFENALSRAVGFHAMLNRHVTLGSRQTVLIDNVITNIGNAYNSQTGHFTAPYDGMYFFASSFLKTGDRTNETKELHLQMVKNSDEISKGHATKGESETGAMNTVVSLKRDVVKVRHFPGISNSQSIHGNWSYFTGYFI